MRVKITGKLVSGIVRGNAFAYILPGRLEVVPPPGEKPTVKVLKVLARGPWRLGNKPDPVQLVIRSAKVGAFARIVGQPSRGLPG